MISWGQKVLSLGGLLIRERSKGKTLRQLGQVFGKSHEKIRQVLAEYDVPQIMLVPESNVAAKLGYPGSWLARLRKDGVINPIKPGGYWLYSKEQISQIPVLIAEMRKCQRCGRQRPPGSVRFCRECRQYRERHKYESLSPEAKVKYAKRCLAWLKANPERAKEIRFRADRKYQAKQGREAVIADDTR